MTDFTGVYAKLGRAEHHLVEFEQVLQSWLSTNPVSLVATMDSTGLREELHISLLSAIPSELDLILGDCVHNFRSTLDYLAMTLAVTNGADIYDSSIQFPIFNDASEFQSKGVRRIKKLPLVAQQFIEAQQPFHRTGETWILEELNALDNQDKHRSVLTHKMTPLWAFEGPEGVHYEYPEHWLIEEGAHFATVIYDAGYAGPLVRPPFHAGLTVERSNHLGFVEVQPFLRERVLPHVRDAIIAEAVRLFP